MRLRSESHISFGCAAEAPPPRNRVMIFNKPFLIMLQRSDAKMPYFALWIGNAELLQRVDPSILESSPSPLESSSSPTPPPRGPDTLPVVPPAKP